MVFIYSFVPGKQSFILRLGEKYLALNHPICEYLVNFIFMCKYRSILSISRHWSSPCKCCSVQSLKCSAWVFTFLDTGWRNVFNCCYSSYTFASVTGQGPSTCPHSWVMSALLPAGMGDWDGWRDKSETRVRM